MTTIIDVDTATITEAKPKARKVMQVFFAHRKDEPALDELAVSLRVLFERTYPEAEVTLVLGRDHAIENMHDMGGWQGWTRYMAQDARFDAVVVPDTVIGRATAEIITGMLQRGVPVVWWDRQETAAKVVELTRLPGDSWKSWATLQLG